MRFRLSIFFLIFAFSLVFAKANPTRMGDHLMQRGDYSEALQEFRGAEKDNPDDPEILWRVGAALTKVGLSINGNGRHDSLEIGVNYLNRAIVAESSIIEAHLEYARALGYLALFKPNWDDVRVARRVNEELNLVLKDDDECADALFLMGLWHRWVSPRSLIERKPRGLGSASIDSSGYYLRQAVKQDKENIEYKLELARLYFTIGNEAAGRELLVGIVESDEVPEKFAPTVKLAEAMLYELDNPGEIEE